MGSAIKNQPLIFSMSDRKSVYKKYDQKRLSKPRISAITDVPEAIILKLEHLTNIHGSKKQAIINAINESYKLATKEK